MAEIVSKFNTVDKTLVVTVDGKKVPDVAEVYIAKGYSDDGKFGCSLTTMTQDEDQGVYKMTRLVAQKSVEALAAGDSARPHPDHSSLLVLPAKSKAQSDIEKFFGGE